MRIGFFTDTYFPQVSGVSTSIRTLKNELEKMGHEVYIFTTTDPAAEAFEKDIVRMPSVPFVSFKDRRIVVRGMWFAYQIAKELDLDIIHTHTEFGAGFLGKMVASRLKIPVVHTYHTMYERYLHYIGNGKVVNPSMVRHFSRLFVNHSTGVVCPSTRVVNTLKRYGVNIPMRVIPTGIEVEKFVRPDITEEMRTQLRRELNIQPNERMILSLSRISYEKNIQVIIQQFPQILAETPNARLVIVGKGPYKEELEKLVAELELQAFVQFTGEIAYERVAYFYRAADYFVSASTSETQGLTYAEAIASGTQCVVEGNEYLDELFDQESLGVTFAGEEAFAQTFNDYVKRCVPLNKKKQAEKLSEISAARFGESMASFYQEMLTYYQENHEQAKEKRPRPAERLRVKLASLKNTLNK